MRKKNSLLFLAAMLGCQPMSIAAETDATPPEQNSLNNQLSTIVPKQNSSSNKQQLIASDHEQNKLLKMNPIKLGALIQVAGMRPILLDGERDMPISLKECLDYGWENSLSIRISKESYMYQQAALAGQLAGFIPSFSLSYVVTKSHVLDPETHSTSTVFAPRVTYPVFQGGSVLQGVLVQAYRTKGWKYTHQTNINSALLTIYKDYTYLSLAHALLRIRLKAVEVSKSELKLNEDKLKSGTGTRYNIVQSKSQLASDEQALLAQQIATRQASITLAYNLHMPLAINLVPVEQELKEVSIISDSLSVQECLETAVQSRPDLREYEMFKYAARRNVQLTAAGLYPSVSLSTSANNSNTTVNSSSSSSTTSSSSTSNSSSSSSSNTAGAGIYGGTYNTVQRSMSLSWSLANMGVSTAANILGARALARQALLQANQELELVREQVRIDYITFKSARQQIDTAAAAAAASAEALRLADLRLGVGNGTNVEVLQAENKYISDLYSQAQAIVTSNQAQAQLLYDMGTIDCHRLVGATN
ncbi:MAG: TolC family protein [Candidatus Obscuribacterales bacterium]|nr:TolC family protein [Candidatus Obscuribacterales bacterium]